MCFVLRLRSLLRDAVLVIYNDYALAIVLEY